MVLPCQRALFEVPDGVAYLDCAAWSPLPRSVRAAGEAGVASKSTPWSADRAEAAVWAERARAAAGRLVGARADDMAIVDSVGYGIAVALANLVLPAGGRVLRAADEHGSLAMAFDRLAAERGLASEVVPRPADGDWTAALAGAIGRPGAAPLVLAGLTPLHWSDGALIDLEVLLPLARRQGAATIVDATQSAGAMPTDVARLQPDFLVFPTYKWLLGPYGLAFLYTAAGHQAGLPLHWTVDNHAAAGARRYDKGHRNEPVTLPMAATGMELVERLGVAAIGQTLAGLTAQLAERAEALGLSVLPAARRAPHILGARRPGGLPPGLVERLAAAGLFVSNRLGVLRISPHVWVNEADLAHFSAALSQGLADSG